MNTFDIKSLKAGDAVSIVRYCGFGTVTSTIGTVIKINKVKAFIKDSNGIERVFSVKKNIEFNVTCYRAVRLEGIETKNTSDAF